MTYLTAFLLIDSKFAISFLVKLKEDIVVKFLFTLASIINVLQVGFSEQICPAILSEYLCVIYS